MTSIMSFKKETTLFLFDVDGTLTLPRQKITKEMWDFLKSLKDIASLAIVGGSDYSKILEQLGGNATEIFQLFDFFFTENGLYGFQGTTPLSNMSLLNSLGEEKLQDVINFCLNYISTIQLPLKRGNFIEFRKGMLNVSPIGRSCSQAERDQFYAFDKENHVRLNFATALRERFANYGLTFSIGGQISIDIFPNGWDKTYCLRYLTPKYTTIHFFGDRTQPGGNDHEIFMHPATIGHTVENPQHTRKLIKEIFLQ